MGWPELARREVAGARVLVVDDESSVRSVLERIIRRSGHEVTSAASAEEADRWLSTSTFDLCVLDLGLPGMNGADFLRWAFERDREMAVIMLTGEDRPEVAAECLAQGARMYLVKPVDPRFLSWAMRDALALRQLLLERNRVVEAARGRGEEVGT